MPKLKILAIDVGIMSGWFFTDGQKGEIKFKDPLQYYTEVKKLFILYKPTHFICCRPVRFPQIIAKHSKLISLIELICYQQGVIYFTSVIDSEVKKKVLGAGNAKKPQIMDKYKEKSEHIADAMMFEEYLRQVI